MTRRDVLLTAASLIALAAACGPRGRPPSGWVASEAPNYHRIGNDLATANAVSLQAIPRIARAGFKTIVDLRLPSESGVAEEAAAAQRAGIRYINIPVTLATLKAAEVHRIAAVLDRPANRPVLLHCASGNRVGAVMALYREQIHGVDREVAQREARILGLQTAPAAAAVERVRREMEASPAATETRTP